MIPFDSMVEYRSISAKDQSRIHQLVRKCFLEYSLDVNCVRGVFWKRDILVFADIDELENLDS